jgi:hypothetical protein
MLYNSNFDDSGFYAKNTREFNKTIDDPCAVQKRNEDNDKKLKFITTNHIDLLQAKEKLNFYGMTIKDQLFVPSENIDKETFLKYGGNGNIITHEKSKSEFGQLPFSTIPAQYQLAHGDLKVENNLLYNSHVSNRQSCNPRDNTYYDRSFYIFDDSKGIDTPDALKSVENTSMWGTRGGMQTRFLEKK